MGIRLLYPASCSSSLQRMVIRIVVVVLVIMVVVIFSGERLCSPLLCLGAPQQWDFNCRRSLCPIKARGGSSCCCCIWRFGVEAQRAAR